MNPSSDQVVAVSAIFTEAMGGPPISAASLAESRKFSKRESAVQRRETLEILSEMMFAVRQMDPERQSKVDASLAAQGLPNRTELFAIAVKVYLGKDPRETMLAAVLARGKILSDEESGVVGDFLDDLTSDLTDNQRRKLGRMINAFHGRPEAP